jgi:hypothetical protein
MIARHRRRPFSALARPGRVTALALAAALVFGVALAQAAVKAGKYAGTSSEGGAVTLTINANGKTITHFDAILGYNGKCGEGGGPGLTAAPSALSIGNGGSFSRDVTLSLTGIPTPIHDPGRVFGKASGSTVTGTIEQFLKGKVNKCYVETFTARLQ